MLSALAIFSPAGIVIHTGDFKVDYTPVFGDAIETSAFLRAWKKGVLALMCDSSNAERLGFTDVRADGRAKTFDNIFARNAKTFVGSSLPLLSNVDRVQQIIILRKYGRKWLSRAGVW